MHSRYGHVARMVEASRREPASIFSTCSKPAKKRKTLQDEEGRNEERNKIRQVKSRAHRRSMAEQTNRIRYTSSSLKLKQPQIDIKYEIKSEISKRQSYKFRPSRLASLKYFIYINILHLLPKRSVHKRNFSPREP